VNAATRPERAAAERPLFIFGCGRSGTSLLSRMLDSHPAIAVPYESHLYNRIYPRLRPDADLGDARTRERLLAEILRTSDFAHWNPAPRMEAVLAEVRRADFHGLVDALLRSWTRSRGKRRWGEKTPHHTLVWRLIYEGFPNLQVLHMVRDGRDVALSFREAPFGPKHVYQAARHWARHVDAAEEARAALGAEGFLQVRYEDLLAAPEPELRRICGFLGEPYEPAMLEYHRREDAYPTDERNTGALRRPVQAGNREKWRAALTPRELRIFEAVAGAQLERYGYPRAAPAAELSRWEELSCRYLEHPPRRLLGMLRARRRGVSFWMESFRLGLTLRYLL
jgi:hypothetical protein